MTARTFVWQRKSLGVAPLCRCAVSRPRHPPVPDAAPLMSDLHVLVTATGSFVPTALPHLRPSVRRS